MPISQNLNGEILAVESDYLMRYAADAESHCGLFGEPVAIDNIGVLEFSGVVEKRGSNPYFKSASLQTLEDDIFAMQEQGIDTVVMHIDSPGGYVTGLPETHRVIAESDMNVIAYCDTCMCSAAYYIATAADHIVAAPSSTVGSVGVYGMMVDQSEAAAEAGVKVHVIRSGDLKGAGLPGKEVTDVELAHEQAVVDRLFADFKSKVQDARPNVSDEVWRGAAYPADQAMELGLVDSMADRVQDVLAVLIEQ